ncbi:MAG: hypothetical protein ACE5G0_08345 [Rhodothermales bacterium]
MTEIASPPEPATEPTAATPEPTDALVPKAPPAPAWVEAEAEARALVETLDEATQLQWRQGAEAVVAGVLTPLRTTVEKAAASHRRLAKRAAFEDDDPASERWRKAIAYRKAVAENVLASVRSHLAHQKIGDTLGTQCLEMGEALKPQAEAAPYNCTLHRPFDLYAREEGDGLWRRARKGYVRAKRRLQHLWLRLKNRLRRLVRQPLKPLPAQGRLVPLRDLCSFHVRMRVPRTLVPLHEALQQHIAGIVGRLETGLTDWTHAVLDAERQLDQIAFHQPPILQDLMPADDGAPKEDQVDPDVVGAFVETASQLQQILDDVAAALAFPTLEAEDRLREASSELVEDLHRAGTFLFDQKAHLLPPPDQQPAAQMQARTQQWATWHQQTVDRLHLNIHLLALRKELLRLQDSLLQRISKATLRPVVRTFTPVVDRLRAAEQEAAEACDAAAASDDVSPLMDTLRALQTRSMQELRDALSDLPGLVSADQALAEPGHAEWGPLHSHLQQVPEHLLLHALHRDEKVLVPEKRPWRMDLRLVAEDILAPFAERLVEPAQPLRKQIVRVWGGTEQVGHIVQYNLDVALDELVHAMAAEEPEASAEDEVIEDADPVKDARELATDGLRRAADTLMDLARSLETPWHTFAEAVLAVFQKDWADLHRSARTEAFVEEQWIDFWRRASRQAQRLRRQARERRQQFVGAAARGLQKLRKRTKDLIERGRSAVGAVEATDEDRFQTIDAISPASLHALHDRLPLVYRKLFSFEPVVEPSLLEGRAADLDRVVHHFERWKNGQSAGALVLALPLGSGRTSLLNVVRAKLHSEATVYTLPLRDRLFEASGFAACVAETLGLEMIGESSLEALETQLLSVPRAEPLRVCMIDNLEYLLLRAPGGTDLIERILTFFSRTDTHICWMATIGVYSWRFLEKIAGTATSLVTTYRPAMLTCETLEALIINRHRRSGLALRFAEPNDLPPLVRQRLRRAQTPEARQAILRNVYFDRLFRWSGQNVMLALFYWLRSTDFEAEEGMLTVRPVRPLSFRFFAGFDLARAFTLKAFMLHNTLTLEEHSRIFRMTDAESTYILESLLNLRLIEPCDSKTYRESIPFPARIFPSQRYRLHALILHPTFELLRERNIVY